MRLLLDHGKLTSQPCDYRTLKSIPTVKKYFRSTSKSGKRCEKRLHKSRGEWGSTRKLLIEKWVFGGERLASEPQARPDVSLVYECGSGTRREAK